jgi:pectate lyase-like protein
VSDQLRFLAPVKPCAQNDSFLGNTMKKSLLVLFLAACLNLLNGCGGGGSAPPPPPAPTVTITASPISVIQGQSVTLTWFSTNATSCTASASPSESDWSGTHATSGSQSVAPASSGTVNYTLMCTGAGGSGSGAASVKVTAVHFSVSGPANVPSGISFNFTVTALDASNNTVTSYSGTVHFTSTDPHAQLPPDSTLVSGSKVFSATLMTAGSQMITATDTATASIMGSSNSINVGALADAFPVETFGAKGDGKTDDTAAIQNAINAAAAAGGGSVVFKVARYFTTGTFLVPDGVVLCGTVEGPFDVKGVDPAVTAIAPTLLVTNTSAPFLTLRGNGSSGVTDLLFHYPNQVKTSASAPTAYPYTILLNSGRVARSTVTNAYNFLDIEVGGRTSAQDLYIGAFNIGVHIDHTQDFLTLHNLHNGVFWDEVEGASYPTTIDSWVLNNGTGLVLNRVDGLEVHDFFVFSRFAGIFLTDSPDATLNPRCAAGQGSDIELETVQYGIIATATRLYTFANLQVGAAPGLGQAAVQLRAGASDPGCNPQVLINGGSVRGSWALGAFPTPAAGNLTAVCIIGTTLPCP